MTKITTDFTGSETIAVTKQRLTDILAYWGASTAAYTTWGQARTALNALLTSTTAGTIGSTELAGSFLPKINFLNDPDEMIADALFGAGEQGVWLDPSDVANVAWRRNLLLWTEQFDNAAGWATQRATVTANASTAPDSTSTADKLAETTDTGVHILFSNNAAFTSVPNSAYTATIYAKEVERRYIVFGIRSSGAGVGTAGSGSSRSHITVDLRDGAISQVTNTTSYGVTSVGSGWYKIIVTTSGFDRNDMQPSLVLSDVAAPPIGAFMVVSYAGTAGSGIFAWGAQLEVGSVATEYQRITDLNTEIIERFPNATMYQDAAGTVPVYAPGQPVGLRLDKSKGLVLGSELVVNGGFATDTIWTKGTGWTISGGVATKTAGTASNLYQPIFATDAAAKNKITVITFDATVTAGSFTVSSGGYNASAAVTASGSYSFKITASEPSSDRTFYVLASAAFAGTIDNVSVKELTGNHATQSTAGSRPMYGIEPKGGRRNLLVQTENFAPIDWTKTSLTVSGNQVSYAGGLGGAKECVQLVTVPGGTASKVLTAYVTVSGSGTFRLKNTHSGVLDNFSANITATSTPQTVILTVTNGASAGNGLQAIAIINSTGDAAFNLTVHQFQLELGSTATNYQRVTTAFDVTEAGVNTCHYCQYDGSNSGMITNSIDFTATDKMSVFAGVWKRSDVTSYAMVAELSAAASSNNGAFALMAPFTASTYGFALRGTLSADAVTAASFAAPRNNVLTALGDISGDLATLRVNGVQAAQNTSDRGTGNFGTYPLYIGRRANGDFPFNGRDYGILVTGKLANATAIATTEMWLANKTSGVSL